MVENQKLIWQNKEGSVFNDRNKKIISSINCQDMMKEIFYEFFLDSLVSLMSLNVTSHDYLKDADILLSALMHGNKIP